MNLNQAYTKGRFTTLFSFYLMLASSLSFAESGSISHEDLNSKIGQAIFEKIWVFAPSSTVSSDGLGPLYNARSCHQCHNPSRKNKNNIPTSLVIQLSIEPNETDQGLLDELKQTGFLPEPVYGKQLQTFASPGANSEAEVSISYTAVNITFSDGEKLSLSKPDYIFSNLGYGELHQDFRFSPRVATRMTGLSWLESIPEQQIVSNADPDDKNEDGISGKINWVWDSISRTTRLGRFGWKASKATLEQQNLAALSTDIGLSSWLFPKAEGDCTPVQSHCTQLAKSTETFLMKSTETHFVKTKSDDSLFNEAHNNNLMVEASKEIVDFLLLFSATMGQKSFPKLTKFELESVKSGEKLFNQIGCQRCHVSDYDNIVNTYTNDTVAVTISPYTDLLLHDMGDQLADHRKEFEASGREWRTAPLWGISDYLKSSPNPEFLHDGRAKSIVEAILWHNGEAKKSKQAFMALTIKERTTLTNFVESL